MAKKKVYYPDPRIKGKKSPELKNVFFGRKGNRKDGFIPTFTIGNQQFTIDVSGGRPIEEVRWYHMVLTKAFKTLIESNKND